MSALIENRVYNLVQKQISIIDLNHYHTIITLDTAVITTVTTTTTFYYFYFYYNNYINSNYYYNENDYCNENNDCLNKINKHYDFHQQYQQKTLTTKVTIISSSTTTTITLKPKTQEVLYNSKTTI